MRNLHCAMFAAAFGLVVCASSAQAQPYGYGMMGPGMMGGYGGHGPGWMMHGYGYGPGMMGYGPGYYGNQGDFKLTTDQVKNYLEQMIRNPNLKVGDVKEKDADTIVAEIVTNNRHTRYLMEYP